MKKEKKDKKPFQWVARPQIISALRRLFVRSPMFKCALDQAKVEVKTYNKDGAESKKKRYKYKCAICDQLFFKEKVEIQTETGKVKKKVKISKVHAIQVDHQEPTIGVEGWKDWNTYIDRMFVGVEVWNDNPQDIVGKVRILCHWCHASVSAVQNAERREIKNTSKVS